MATLFSGATRHDDNGNTIPDDFQNGPRRTKPGYQSIVAINDRNGVIYLGRRDAQEVAFLKPHRFGLELVVRTPGRFETYKRFVIPGEVPKSRAVEFIRRQVPGDYARNSSNYKPVDRPWVKRKDYHLSVNSLSHEIDIAKALDDSGFWAQRGRMDPQKKIPPAFFKKYPVEELARGRHTSIQAWWKDCLARSFTIPNLEAPHALYKPGSAGDKRVQGLRDAGDKDALAREFSRARACRAIADNRRSATTLIELGLLPESPTAIRKFDKISLYRLNLYLQHDLHRAKTFPRFITSVAPTFHKVLDAHHWLDARGTNRPTFDEMVARLERLPKTEKAVRVLDEAINEALSREAFCKMPTVSVPLLEEFVAIKKEMRRIGYQAPKDMLNKNYQPPNIPLEPGWQFADHETFRTLSDQYSICISNGYGYEDSIIKGHAHVLFREDHRTLGGAVAFIEYGDEHTRRRYEYGKPHPPGWAVVEIRGFGNSTIHPQYDREAHIAAKTLTKLQPGPSPRVPTLSRDDRVDSLGKLEHRLLTIVPDWEPVFDYPERMTLYDEAVKLQREQQSVSPTPKRGRRK
jgi:hypothetical protein